MEHTLTVDTPEVDNWVRDLLDRAGIVLHTVEGYAVRDGAVTALLERRRSSVNVRAWSGEEVAEELTYEHTFSSWRARWTLARRLDVPLYVVLWREDGVRFRVVFSVARCEGGALSLGEEELFDSCEALAAWMARLKGMPVSKGFVERGRLGRIDRCLQEQGVPWPGNLDGFLFDPLGEQIGAIVEFSRTRKARVAEHDVNRYYRQDVNRWRPLDIL